MLEKFESGLIDSFCHFYFMYFVFLEGVFVAHDYIARQIKGLIIILIPIHECNQQRTFLLPHER